MCMGHMTADHILTKYTRYLVRMHEARQCIVILWHEDFTLFYSRRDGLRATMREFDWYISWLFFFFPWISFFICTLSVGTLNGSPGKELAKIDCQLLDFLKRLINLSLDPINFGTLEDNGTFSGHGPSLSSNPRGPRPCACMPVCLYACMPACMYGDVEIVSFKG